MKDYMLIREVTKKVKKNSLRLTQMIVTLLLLFSANHVMGADPEYMRLPLEVGQSVEIKGYWDSTGYLVATDLEGLPKPRRPKLRGLIQSIDRKASTIVVFGRTIKIVPKTVFLESDSGVVAFDMLKQGQHIEVSCKTDSSGNWIARRVRTNGVKKNDKVKGTITRSHIDGTPPDTIVIGGLKILLNKMTDVEDPTSFIDRRESELFGELSRNGALNVIGDYPVGDRIVVSAETRLDARSESRYTLLSSTVVGKDTVDGDARNALFDVRLEGVGYWNEVFRSEAVLRIRQRYLQTNDMNKFSDKALVQFTKLNLLAMNIGGKGISAQVGRLDIDEPRQWLFDEYLDAVRLYYYGTEPMMFEAAVIYGFNPIKDKFDTWTDIFTQATWYRGKSTFASVYMLKRSDSDTLRNREPVWWGARYFSNPHSSIRGWADISMMRGNDKGESLEAWAMDIGSIFKLKSHHLRPSITIGYAFGSGDDPSTPNTNEQFRQTAYQDNTMKFSGRDELPYYGAVLDPELSNLKVTTIGAGIRPTPKSSVELVYHSYRQQYADNDLKGSNLIDPPALPNGSETNLGWGLDLIVAFPKLWDRIRSRFIAGLFSPGSGYEPRTDNALIAKLDVRLAL